MVASSFAHPSDRPLLMQPGGRWQGGKGKYPRHYEVGVADLVEMGHINGWHIRRCDIARFLLVEPLQEREGHPLDETESHGDGPLRTAFVLLFPPRQYRMVVPLLLHIGEPVPFAALFAEGTYVPERDRLLREKVVKPLRKKLALLGLSLRHLIGYGYLVQVEPEKTERSQEGISR
jgi:hypothetical protein